MREPCHMAAVYVEYSLRSRLSPTQHLTRKCCPPLKESGLTARSPEECAQHYLDSLPETERRLCVLAQKNEDRDVDRLLRRTLRRYSTESEVSALLYKIWYKVLLEGASAGCLLSCISVCGMVVTIAVEMGIPVDNVTQSLEKMIDSRRRYNYWGYVKGVAIKLAFYVGSQYIIAVW